MRCFVDLAFDVRVSVAIPNLVKGVRNADSAVAIRARIMSRYFSLEFQNHSSNIRRAVKFARKAPQFLCNRDLVSEALGYIRNVIVAKIIAEVRRFGWGAGGVRTVLISEFRIFIVAN